ncbi:MAG TPA: ClpX C4-type zinc finger protein [Labilithrix sp.]|jgi:hypothetical protein
MALDEALLTRARAKHDDLRHAEKKVDMARADFHYAVRRLHLAGASIREVAHAIGISHQRVQQIVQAAGGTWWSRMWRGRNVRPDMTCSFCGLPPSALAKLLAGPAVHICDACVARAEDALFDGGSPGNTLLPVPPSRRAECSFCARRVSTTVRCVGTSEHRICNDCLVICRGILDERGAL